MKLVLSKSIAPLLAVAALCIAAADDGWAQQKCKRSGKNLAADTKYTQQHVIDVGDIPGHQVRILELHRTPSNAKPNCEGHTMVESWNRGYSDYINTNGRSWGYSVVTLDNGDKIYVNYSGTSQTTFDADGSRKSTYTGVYTFTGGTGKYRGIRGMGRDVYIFDPKAGFNEGQWEEEYWIEE